MPNRQVYFDIKLKQIFLGVMLPKIGRLQNDDDLSIYCCSSRSFTITYEDPNSVLTGVSL